MNLSRNWVLREHFWGHSGNIINTGAWVCAFSTVLKILYRSFFIYLTIDKVGKGAFEAGMRWTDNIGDLESSLRFLSGEIDLKEKKSDRPNKEL